MHLEVLETIKTDSLIIPSGFIMTVYYWNNCSDFRKNQEGNIVQSIRLDSLMMVGEHLADANPIGFNLNYSINTDTNLPTTEQEFYQFMQTKLPVEIV